MKNIKSILLIFFIAMVSSCENEIDPIVSADGLLLRKDAAIISPILITDENNTAIFTKLNWDKANNGVASVTKDSLVIFDHDYDPNLENPITYKGQGLNIPPSVREAILTEKEFNDLVNQLPTFKCSQMNIDIRIKSTLGISSNAFVQYSNPITYAITAKSTAKPILTLVKNGNESNAKNEPKILASASGINTDYQGYMYLTAGSYKFYQPDLCGDFSNPTIYGGNTTMLSIGGADLNVSSEGHYYVTVNLTTNTYSIKQFKSVGVFGNGVRIGPGVTNATQLYYNSTDKTWSRELDIVKGRTFSFKTDLWTGEEVINTINNNPPTIPTSGTTTISYLELNNQNNLVSSNSFTSIFGTIDVPGVYDSNIRQKYLITVDLKSPRDYKYSLKIK